MPFFASFVAISASLLAAVVPAIDLPGQSAGSQPAFPAPPGYVLPWIGGELHSVTQGEETSLTHNGAAAYAFDFDLAYATVVAARSGKVTMVRQDSNVGGCGALFSSSANYVLVDHGDGTSGLYLHLAQDSVTVKVGDLVDQGQPLALSGETGLTCSDDNSGPGPHLHFQVERTEEHRYFTQSLPIAFDDVSKDDGVLQQDATYMSGNYGRGKPRKIKLTPHRTARVFNPVATPKIPDLLEADPAPVPASSATPVAQAAPAEPGATAETAEPKSVAPAEARPTPEPTHRPTRTPSPSDTPETAPSDTPVPPRATDTPVPPASTDTRTPAPTDQPASPSPTPAASATSAPA
ncbi:MAG: peptidoglycan DD-metalloendopeptidase family protein [Chloroflexota bacterium]|nr:peptidoglycan DD-metalloendopeptidase family protein [Chloroflexota bacterium]